MREKIQLWKDGTRVLIRSKYSEMYDLVVELWHTTDENAWLITPDMPITDFDKGRQIHLGPDDFPASFFGEYGTLSGNHASCFAVQLMIFDHGMSEKDLGAIFTDEYGNKFCLMHIIDSDFLIIHPVASGTLREPGFVRYNGGKLFYNGRLLSVIASSNIQLYPSNRFNVYCFLADGKTPLADRELTECTYLDHVMEYDVVSPIALVEMMKNNPGRKHFPGFSNRRKMVMPEDMTGTGSELYKALPALISYKVTMRHEASGACVIYRNVTTKQELTWLEALDVMYIWSGECCEMPVQEFYIPGIKPVTLKATDGRTCEMDFAGVARFDTDFPADCNLTQDDCTDPALQPRRFIRFAGDESARQIGVAIGYSHCHGLTASPQWSTIRPELYHFFVSWKMYPRVYHVDNPPVNWSVDTVAYRQYFHPADPELTSMYYHHEYDDLIVWIDCHKTLQNKTVTLPEEVAGCHMKIVEKTDSFVIAENSMPQSCQLTFDVSGSSGYAILHFSCQK